MGFTQEQLAEECGVSRQAVTKWECGESEPTIAKLIVLLQILQPAKSLGRLSLTASIL